jgi:hypothetical protein
VKVPSPVVGHDLYFLSGGNPRGRDFYAVRPNGDGDISIASGIGWNVLVIRGERHVFAIK